MSNLKVLENRNGIDYIWDLDSAKRILKQYALERNITKQRVYEEITKKCVLSDDAAKNWFTGKNGPSNIDFVKNMAEIMEQPYEHFLQALYKERDIMNTITDLLPDFTENDGLNVTTIRFISLLNDLAEYSKGGYIGFSKYRYDTIKSIDAGIIFDDAEGPNYGKIIADICVDENHHDIVSTYDQIYGNDCDIRVRSEESDDGVIDYWIDVTGINGLCIVIENGRWYWA